MSRAAEFQTVDGGQAGLLLDELSLVYAEVYADPPYEWGDEYVAAFRKWFEVQRQQEGFHFVTARLAGELVGFGFGVTLPPTAPWWQELVTPLPADMTREYPGRTWALVELLVRAPWC